MEQIKLYKQTQYSGKGDPSRENLPHLPWRGLLLGPSSAGKTTLIVSMLLHQYRGCFERIYVMSPSVDVDDAWKPVKEYSEKELGVDQQKERTFFHEWQPEVLEALLDRQLKLTELQKKRKYREMYQIAVIIDDFADRADVMHNSGNILTSLFIRGRHGWISTLVSSQKLRAIATPLRVNATFICCFRLRNAKELESLLEELTAIYPIDVLRQMYEMAVREPYSFWYINLLKKKPEEMFRIRFETRLLVE